MGKKNDYDDEEMTVELELDDGPVVNCAVITILTVADKDYIVLLPIDENGENEDVVVGQKFGHWDYLWIFAGFDLWIVIVDISLISASGGVLFG